QLWIRPKDFGKKTQVPGFSSENAPVGAFSKEKRTTMHDHTTEQELKDRLSLIEHMIAEGRRNTESWGWAFVLWGVVYYLAIAWSAWGHRVWAWPVTILIAVIVTVVVASLKAGNHPETTLGRA